MPKNPLVSTASRKTTAPSQKKTAQNVLDSSSEDEDCSIVSPPVVAAVAADPAIRAGEDPLEVRDPFHPQSTVPEDEHDSDSGRSPSRFANMEKRKFTVTTGTPDASISGSTAEPRHRPPGDLFTLCDVLP